MPYQNEKIAGSLWGGAVGDALGAPVEFLPYTAKTVNNYIEFEDGKGSITDDTQMTIFTLEAMLFLEQNTQINSIESYFEQSYQRWLTTQIKCYEKSTTNKWIFPQLELWQHRAPGNTCLNALASGSGANNSKGCGGVMRTAPCGMLKIKNYDPFTLGVAAAKVTHGHPNGYLTGGFLAHLIYELVHKKQELMPAINSTILHLKHYSEHQETLQALEKAISMYQKKIPCTPQNIAILGEGWIAEEALAISIFCALTNQNDFNKGVLSAVNITGDRDSTGAITGNILGAVNGVSAIEKTWMHNLKEHNLIAYAIELIETM